MSAATERQTRPIEARALPGALEGLYAKYNRREFVSPDPLQFLYAYEDAGDREIAGLVAASLAYGRVAQILRSVAAILDRMGPRPAAFLRGASAQSLRKAFSGFRHRFTSGADMAAMLSAARRMTLRHGSLGAFLAGAIGSGDETVLPALDAFARAMDASGGGWRAGLIPSPGRGSACKRLNLYLRWMVRRDDVDPGGWKGIPPSKLVVPLDTHMHRIGLALGLTARRQADIGTALEITKAFRAIRPEDPVRYDFSLTRLGIRKDEDLGDFIRNIRWGAGEPPRRRCVRLDPSPSNAKRPAEVSPARYSSYGQSGGAP